MIHPLLPSDIRTPAYILDVKSLKKNLLTVQLLKKETGAKILLATKAWAMPAAFSLMKEVLDGTTASGEYEAKMGHDEFGKEVHVYSPGYTDGEIQRLLKLSDHIYFNSPSQFNKYAHLVKKAGLKVGVRINPGYSSATLGGQLYDPCAPGSRFGITKGDCDLIPWNEVDILHAHALCEAREEGSIGLIQHVTKNFAEQLKIVKAVNFGGGHFINRPGYKIELLIEAIRKFRNTFRGEIILEPGAGLVVNTGWLISTVLDIHRNIQDIAILDTSASTHMPDVLEVPYRPTIIGAGKPGEYPHTYILGGKTCMTGDVIGEYSFKNPLSAGDRVIFTDMMQYSFVKNTTFNGTPLPDLGILYENGSYEVVGSFGYNDFRKRLG